MNELDEAIAHWVRLSECKTSDEFYAEGWHGEECVLCTNREDQLYEYRHCNMKDNPCPIYAHTGKTDCHGTPWYEASTAIRRFCSNFGREELLKSNLLSDAQLNCRVMVDFLKGLREDPTTDDYERAMKGI